MEWIKKGIFLLALLSVSRAVPIPFAGGDDSRVLPVTSVPNHYDLKLALSVDDTIKTSGVVKIQIEILEDTNVITLNNRGLDIVSIKLLIESEPDEIHTTFDIDSDKDFMHIQVDSRELLRGEKVSAEITFTGTLQTLLLGIYRTQYKFNDAIR